MLSPQTASPASWNPPTAGGDTTDDEEGPRPAPVAPEHVLLETTPPPPPPASAKWKEGDKVIARWHLGCHYPGTIHAVKANGVYAVSFDDGGRLGIVRRNRAARLSLRGHLEGRAGIVRLVADAELFDPRRGGHRASRVAGGTRRGWVRGRGAAVVGVVSAALVLLYLFRC